MEASRASLRMVLFVGTFLWVGVFAVIASEVVYEAGKRRDPFVPLADEAGAEQAVSGGAKLEGIIYDPSGKSIAVLSGKTYMEGDSVGDAKVLEIFKDRVVLGVDNERKELKLRKTDI